jgi:type I restriction enzyme S subunit
LDSAFENIDKLKANAEKQLAEARILFQKSLAKAMEPKEGWEEKTLKEVSVISGDYGLSVSSKPFDGVRYLRITDITEFGDLNDDKVSANVDESKKQEELEEGDILFARTGATVGKTLVYRKEFGECLFAGYLIRYRLDKNVVDPRFMFYLTHSNEYYNWVNLNQEAAAQPNISAKKYNLLPIKYPSFEMQQRIVERLDSLSENVRKYEEIQRQIISECDALKQALLRKVFE